MEREVQQLRHAMQSRPVIDMARGVLLMALHCSPEETWQIMVRASQNANVRLRIVAEALLESAQGRPLPEDLRTHLTAAVQAVCDLDRSGGHGPTLGG
jgi:hypothetical protein